MSVATGLWNFSNTSSPYGPGASNLQGLDAYTSPGDLLSQGYTDATSGVFPGGGEGAGGGEYSGEGAPGTAESASAESGGGYGGGGTLGDLLSPEYMGNFGAGTPLLGGGTIGTQGALGALSGGTPLTLSLTPSGAVPGSAQAQSSVPWNPLTWLQCVLQNGGNTGPCASLTGGQGQATSGVSTPSGGIVAASPNSPTTGCAAWDIGCAMQATLASALSNKTLWIVVGMILLFLILLRVARPS